MKKFQIAFNIIKLICSIPFIPIVLIGYGLKTVFYDPLKKKKLGMSESELLQHGSQAEATVLSIVQSNWWAGAAPVCYIKLSYQLPGEMERQSTVKTDITLADMPKYQPGCRVAIRYEANHPNNIVLEKTNRLAALKEAMKAEREQR